MARGLSAVLDAAALTVVVNVGDDAEMYGVHVSADLDTVVYTLAGIEGPEGWGVRDDTFEMLGALATLGFDTTFRLGDRDMATCLARTVRLRRGIPLSAVTAELAAALGVAVTVIPASDQAVRTKVLTSAAGWVDFQEYFVIRRHADRVEGLEYVGGQEASPAPGVIAAIEAAQRVIIAPSNPPLSIWPILAVPEVRAAVAAHPKVIAVSPLIGGRALKGPAVEVMQAVELAAGNAGVVEAYDGLIHRVVIDREDAADARTVKRVDVTVTDTRIKDPAAAARLAEELLAQ